jgi:hypothetical protein
MKKLPIFLLLLAWLPATAQVIVGNFGVDYVYSAPSGACSTSSPMEVVVGPGTIYTCQSGLWASIVASTSTAFPLITSGTNTTATMIVDGAASITATGTGIITATSDATLVPTTIYYVDGNRTDTYTPTGSIDLPFKTLDAVYAAMTAAAKANYTVTVAPASYTTSGDLIGTAVPITIIGNGATVNTGAHAMYFYGPFDVTDLNLNGSIAFNYFGATKSFWESGSITGVVYAGGNMQVDETELTGSSVQVFPNSSPFFNGVRGSTTFTTQAATSQLYINNSNIVNAGAAPIINGSAGGLLFITNSFLQNGGGTIINCADGATLFAPNVLKDLVWAVGSAPNCGSAVTYWAKLTAPPIGTALYGFADVDTTLQVTGKATFSSAGAASTPSVLFSGVPFAGTGTTSTPGVYIDQGASEPTTWNTGGTELGINAASGFAGNFLDFHINGGSSLFKVNSIGGVTSADAVSATAFNAGSSPPSCGTATGILCLGQGGTAGTPTSGVDYIRADSGANTLMFSLNGGAETALGTGAFVTAAVASAANQGVLSNAAGTNVWVPCTTNTASCFPLLNGSGYLPTANGGTNSSGGTGYRYANGTGADTYSTTVPLSSVAAAASGSGTYDFSGATQIKVPVANGFASAASGEIGYDSTDNNWELWVNGANNLLAGTFPEASPPTSGHIAGFLKTGNSWSLQDLGALSTGGAPAWMNYYGDGSDGALSYTTGTNVLNNAIYNATTFSCTNATLQSGTDIPLIIRATTSITIGTGCVIKLNSLNDIKGTFGGAGGAGGGGTLASTAAAGSFGYNNGAIAAITAGGVASAASGGTGGTGGTPSTTIKRASVSDGPIFPESGSVCGAGGSAGGSTGGTYGLGGGCIFLIAPTVTLASGAQLNVFGGYGTPAAASSTGSGGGGGGGVVIIRSPNLTDSGAIFNVAPGPGAWGTAVLPTPTNGTLATATTGGSCADSTPYYYRIAALEGPNGISLASTEETITTGSGGGLNTVTIPVTLVPGATGYGFYGRTTGGELLIGCTGSGGGLSGCSGETPPLLSFVDKCTVTPSGALPGSNTTTTWTSVPQALATGGSCTSPPKALLGVLAGALSGTCTVVQSGAGCGTGTGITWNILGGGGTAGTATVNPTWSGGALASCTVTAGSSSGYTATEYATAGNGGDGGGGWYKEIAQ